MIVLHRSHEWLKHGTCSDMPTENEYFGTVLKIFENGLNFGDVLDRGGVKPSSTDTYKVSIMHCSAVPKWLVASCVILWYSHVHPMPHSCDDLCMYTALHNASCLLTVFLVCLFNSHLSPSIHCHPFPSFSLSLSLSLILPSRLSSLLMPSLKSLVRELYPRWIATTLMYVCVL